MKITALLILFSFTLCIYAGSNAAYSIEKFESISDSIEITAQYPVFTDSIYKNMNSTLKNTAEQWFNERVGYADELDYSMLQGKYYESLACSVFGYDQYFASVRFYEESYTGGAHPSHNYFSVNFDFGMGGEVSLEDAPWGDKWLAPAAEYCREDIIKQLLEKDAKDANLLVSEIPAEFSSFKVFNTDGSKIYFTFNEYQLTPYYLGAFTVGIPVSKFMKMTE